MGPEYFHASYSVHVVPMIGSDRCFDWTFYAGIGRMTESAAKVVLRTNIFVKM